MIQPFPEFRRDKKLQARDLNRLAQEAQRNAGFNGTFPGTCFMGPTGLHVAFDRQDVTRNFGTGSVSITASKNNYILPGVLSYITTDASRSITGIAGGYDGAAVWIVNAGSTNDLVLSHQSGSSSAANRIISPTGGDLTLHPGEWAYLIYRGPQTRWNIITGTALPSSIHYSVTNVTLGGDQNNYAVSTSYVNIDLTLNVSITGLSVTNVQNGDTVTINNISTAYYISFPHQSGSSTKPFYNTTLNTIVVGPGTSQTFVYYSNNWYPLEVNVAFQAYALTQITANQNNYALNFGPQYFTLTSDATRTITGLANGYAGRFCILHNNGSFDWILSNNSGSSSAANRVITGTGGDLIVSPNTTVWLQYSSVTNLWYVTGGSALDQDWRIADGTASISANQNDYALAGPITRLSTDAARTLTGFAGGQDGMVRWIYNVGSFDFLIADQSGSSTAANRVITGSGNTVIVQPGQNVAIYYDGTTTRWRIVDGTAMRQEPGLADGSASISANQNDYSLAGPITRLTTDAARTLTGFANGSDGLLRHIYNVGSFDFLIADQSISSTAANRVITGTGNTLIVQPGQNVVLYYDATTSRWRVIGGSALRQDWSLADGAATIAADQNDYALAGPVTYLTPSGAARTITGFAGGSDGLVRHIYNIGSQNLIVSNQSASSTAANRVINENGVDVLVLPGYSIVIIYDASNSRWRQVGTASIQNANWGGQAATVSADQNDYALQAGTVQFITPSGASRTITGFTGGTNGLVRIIYNADATNSLTIANQSISSTAANRVITGTGADLIITALRTAILIYQGSASRWVVVGGTALASASGDNLGNHTATQLLQMSGYKIAGNTTSGGTLTLQSTTHATKGGIVLEDSDFLELNEATTVPGSPGSTNQLRVYCDVIGTGATHAQLWMKFNGGQIIPGGQYWRDLESKSANFTAAFGSGYLVDLGASRTVTLPTPAPGQVITFVMNNGGGTTKCTFNGGSNIATPDADIFLSEDGETITFIGADATSWHVKEIRRHQHDQNSLVSDYTLTNAYADIDATNFMVDFLDKGCYRVWAQIRADLQADAAISCLVRLYNQTGAAAVTSSERMIFETPANTAFKIGTLCEWRLPMSAGDEIRVQAKYVTGGTVTTGVIKSDHSYFGWEWIGPQTS